MQELWTEPGRVPPAVILLELYPKALARKGYMGGTAAVLGKMHAAGYADILHSGFATLLSMAFSTADSVMQLELEFCSTAPCLASLCKEEIESNVHKTVGLCLKRACKHYTTVLRRGRYCFSVCPSC